MRNILKAATLYSSVTVCTIAAAQAAAPKVTEDAYSLALYGSIVVYSTFLGSINFAQAYLKDDGQKHLAVKWFVDAATASVSGLISFWFAQNQGWTLSSTCVLITATALGWVKVLDLMRLIFGKAINVGEDK